MRAGIPIAAAWCAAIVWATPAHAASHFDIRAGYSMLYYKWTVADISIGSFRRTLISRQTLHGPIVGFGIPF